MYKPKLFHLGFSYGLMSQFNRINLIEKNFNKGKLEDTKPQKKVNSKDYEDDEDF